MHQLIRPWSYQEIKNAVALSEVRKKRHNDEHSWIPNIIYWISLKGVVMSLLLAFCDIIY